MRTARVELGPMAKAKMGRPKKPRGEGKLVRLDPGIAEKAKQVAADRGIALADYLAGLLSSPVDRDFLRIMERIKAKEGGER